MGNYISKDELLSQTRGGLDIILHYLPQATDSVGRKGRKFRVRKEDDASAQLSEKDGIWYVKDYGNSEKAKTGIAIAMEEEGIPNTKDGFLKTLNIISSNLNLSVVNDGKGTFAKPRIEKSGKPQKEYTFKTRKEFTQFELDTLGEFVKPEVCERYNLSPLVSYTNKKGTTFFSTEDYPMYIFDWGEFQKVYQPLSIDKAFRFFYIGNKPKDFVYGMQQVTDAHNKFVEDSNDEKASGNEDEKGKKKGNDGPRLKEIIKCSGDRDALNVASEGYHVVWTDSEATMINYKDYKKLTSMCEKFYNLPDIDAPGMKYAYEFAMNYFKPDFEPVHTIYLPDDLKDIRDFRGNPCKDVTDYFKYYKKKESRGNFFRTLVKIALPLRFWDVVINYDRNGNFKGEEYKFKNTRALNFLQANGFYRIENPNEKEGWSFVKVTGKFVENIKVENVSSWVDTFLKENYFPEPVRDMAYRTQQLKAAALNRLEFTEPDFTQHGKDHQTLIFNNEAWKITSSDIIKLKHNELENHVWKHKVIDRNVKILDPMLTADYSKEAKEILKERNKHKLNSKEWKAQEEKYQAIEPHNRYSLTRNDTDFSFLDYIYKTSYMHWKDVEYHGRKETEEDRKIQDLHVLNKLYSLGYLCHKYKIESKAWCVFAMDGKESDAGKHEGGTGKSLFFKAPQQFLSTIYESGQKQNLTDDKHLFGAATKDTDYLYIDDAHYSLNFNYFFTHITGDMPVNAKFTQAYSIPFAQSPKMAITTNNAIRRMDQSTLRRILYTVFSDYFHKKGMLSEYRENRSPDMLYGHNFYSKDWTEDHWNKFFNLIALAIQIYLRFDKIEPPMDNVDKRNIRNQVGDTFFKWADEYFNRQDEDLNYTILDKNIKKSEVFGDFMKETNELRGESGFEKNRNSVNKFKNQVELYCAYKGWVLNPEPHCQNGGRIRLRDPDNPNTVVEWYHIRAGKSLTPQEGQQMTENADVPF
ncbi:MAG: hypothetical protein K9H64_22505 [Bacteroidales bacterium]|nr:hypothetical protein [Bacteroidales bacterium]MCF8458805.1 hypothetical protein [Bacteroidales bacterium]